MKIYKFKDLSSKDFHPHFLQIILKNTIWCSSPNQLNDGDEFKFELDYEASEKTADLLSKVVSKYRTSNFSSPDKSAMMALKNKRLKSIAEPLIRGMIQKCRDTIGIASFSCINNDEHLWDEYGGKGNGACIEINIPDSLVGKSYHRVYYAPQKNLHIDSFLESVLLGDGGKRAYRNSLLTKTKKWSKEDEIRFIGDRQNVNFIIDGYINEVTFGSKVPQDTLKQLIAQIEGHCSSSNIKINRP